MIHPRLINEAFLSDVRTVVPSPDRFDLWWLGQSGFLIAWMGRHLLLDPYLSDSLTRKYAQTDKPHVRMTEIVVDPARLDFIDVASSSHNHTDHLDADTLIPLRAANPALTLVVPEANRTFVAERLKCDPKFLTGLESGQKVDVQGFLFHGLPAAHNELETDHLGRDRFMGYVIQFGPWTIYHSGDTLRYPGMENWLLPIKIDLALLPINGNRPERKVAGNLGAREAAQLAWDIGAKLVVPCHFDMFTFNTASPSDFAAEAALLDQPHRVLECGERFTFVQHS
jgi:L-ascorbate metabolism protein UlaG (beta-lactamase superfamily)